MNGGRQSDRPIVPEKSPNKGGASWLAEGMEGRGLTEGNPGQRNRGRTLSRATLSNGLERIRQTARRKKGERFTALWHHVYDLDQLRAAYYGIKRGSAPGVDGKTWKAYGENLEGNQQELSARLKRGAYRAKPVKRGYIPKRDGQQRAIGLPVLEDKLVQRSTVRVMEAIYEADFKGFSYGFRPKRSAHDALDALAVGITCRKVNWVLDADIRGFFDAIDHRWMLEFIQHRIADKRVWRQVKKWLKAGVLEGGKKIVVEEGTPQGGSISPLLANIYLHYVFDLWADHWRRSQARGDDVMVRFADDFVVGFQYREEAERFLRELRKRLGKFNLELNEKKTRLIEFGRYAARDRDRRGEGKPETFDFLGFTHICGKTRKGRFKVQRKTNRRRMQRKLGEIRDELRRRMHRPIPEVGKWLRSVLRGYYQYHAIAGNTALLESFRYHVSRIWYRVLRRRSQRRRLRWEQMGRLCSRWLPTPRVLHPYPEQSLCVRYPR